MIPTFFGISLIIFVVLNIAPGKPGAAQRSAEVMLSAEDETTQESHRLFREQFNLDKPVLLNTLFGLTEAEVEHPLRLIAKLDESTHGDRVAAFDKLDEYGGYATPLLVHIMQRAHEQGQTELRDAAVHFLASSAKRRLIDPHQPRPSPELRRLNREIEAENSYLDTLRYARSAPEGAKLEVIEKWKLWFTEHAHRYQWGALDKLRILFLETRFAKYWQNLLRLDFGVSLTTREPVFSTLVSKLPYSLGLSVTSLLLAYLIAIPIGIFSAVRRDTLGDRTATVVLFMLYSLPSFFVATVLIYALSEGSAYRWLRWFPTGGFSSPNIEDMTTWGAMRDVAWHLVLPVICMTYASLAAISRYMRSGLLEVIQSDYVRTARAKGLPEVQVIGKHALRNGLLPILTLLAGLLPAVLGGSVIIEYIFGIPGIGLWVIEAIYQRDYNVIMGVQLCSALLVLVGILLTDLSYALVDPRIRYS